jgi:hypothetical protein
MRKLWPCGPTHLNLGAPLLYGMLRAAAAAACSGGCCFEACVWGGTERAAGGARLLQRGEGGGRGRGGGEGKLFVRRLGGLLRVCSGGEGRGLWRLGLQPSLGCKCHATCVACCTARPKSGKNFLSRATRPLALSFSAIHNRITVLRLTIHTLCVANSGKFGNRPFPSTRNSGFKYY